MKPPLIARLVIVVSFCLLGGCATPAEANPLAWWKQWGDHREPAESKVAESNPFKSSRKSALDPDESTEGTIVTAEDQEPASETADSKQDKSLSETYDEETIALIEEELEGATTEERRQLYRDLEGLEPAMVRQILKVRRLVSQMSQDLSHQQQEQLLAQTSHNAVGNSFRGNENDQQNTNSSSASQQNYPNRQYLTDNRQRATRPENARPEMGGANPWKGPSNPAGRNASRNASFRSPSNPSWNSNQYVSGKGSLRNSSSRFPQDRQAPSNSGRRSFGTRPSQVYGHSGLAQKSSPSMQPGLTKPPGLAKPNPYPANSQSGHPWPNQKQAGFTMEYGSRMDASPGQKPSPASRYGKQRNSNGYGGTAPAGVAYSNQGRHSVPPTETAISQRRSAGYPQKDQSFARQDGQFSPELSGNPPAQKSNSLQNSNFEGGQNLSGSPGQANQYQTTNYTAGSEAGSAFPESQGQEPSAQPGRSPSSLKNQGGNWDQTLQQLISLAESKVAQSSPGESEKERLKHLQKHVYLRMLYLMAGQPERTFQPIPSIEAADQEFWQQMFWAMTNYFDAERLPNADDRATQAIAQLNTAILRLQERANLELRNVTFCHKISSFGNYERFDRDEFSPGQPVLVYGEIRNFKSEATADGQYRTVLHSTIEIYKAGSDGDLVERITFPATEDLCRNHRRDYFHSYEVNIPQRISLGPHVLKLTVEDQLSQKIATETLNFTVK